MKLRLSQISHARSGDKGDTADIGLFAWEPLSYAVLAEKVTADALRLHFAHLWSTHTLPPHRAVERFDLPKLLALKFILRGALNGGAASSLRSDNLGKTIAAQLLRMEIDIDTHQAVAVLTATQEALSHF